MHTFYITLGHSDHSRGRLGSNISICLLLDLKLSYQADQNWGPPKKHVLLILTGLGLFDNSIYRSENVSCYSHHRFFRGPRGQLFIYLLLYSDLFLASAKCQPLKLFTPTVYGAWKLFLLAQKMARRHICTNLQLLTLTLSNHHHQSHFLPKKVNFRLFTWFFPWL